MSTLSPSLDGGVVVMEEAPPSADELAKPVRKRKSTSMVAADKSTALALAVPEGLPDAVRQLQKFGALDRGRFIMKPKTTLLEWMTQVLPAAAAMADASQFTLADALLAGHQWEQVDAVNILTGQPASEDEAYDEAAPVVPFSYAQVAVVLEKSPQTLLNLLSVARRFPPESRERFPNARLSHYAAVCQRDLPDEVVTPWLERAGMRGPDGLSVRELETLRDNWRRDRDAATRGRVEILKSPREAAAAAMPPAGQPLERGGPVPKPTSAKGVRAGVKEAVSSGEPPMGLEEAQRVSMKSLRTALATSPLTGDDLDAAGRSVVDWLYHEAPERVILAALAYRMNDEPPF